MSLYTVQITSADPDWVAGGIHETTIEAGVAAYEEAQQRALGWWTHYEAMTAANKLTNRWWPERETISYTDWQAREGTVPTTATTLPFKLRGCAQDG